MADAVVEETIAGLAAPELIAEMEAGFTRFWHAVDAAGPKLTNEWRAQLEAAVMEVAEASVRGAYPAVGKVGNVKLRLRRHGDRVEALITDRGPPIGDAPTSHPDLHRFEYSRRARGSNRWHLVKKIG